ncbi:MAG: hypothetical protein IJI73_02200 [Kiritimatiellae bacterium]|nr:hypothetical protein [Kiritimatiellia bacterium]
MNKLDQEDEKELNLLVQEAQEHTFNGHFFWIDQSCDYGAWKTRAKALLGKALSSSSPDLIRINEHQKPGCSDLEFHEYIGMLMGVKKFSDGHQN